MWVNLRTHSHPQLRHELRVPTSGEVCGVDRWVSWKVVSVEQEDGGGGLPQAGGRGSEQALLIEARVVRGESLWVTCTQVPGVQPPASLWMHAPG
jgi:hypothetical protein